ncbi:MAG: hypothetical protein NWE89_02205 [Candidatus Bathyarchaeota archaeon]|nr:hypothetical protein [Candidatus Bathyarchaeota archaeon]
METWDMLEALFLAASCLVIVVSSIKMRAMAMKDRDKLRRPMNSLILVDQGGPFEWKIVDIGPPMDVALGWVYKKDEDETQETKG